MLLTSHKLFRNNSLNWGQTPTWFKWLQWTKSILDYLWYTLKLLRCLNSNIFKVWINRLELHWCAGANKSEAAILLLTFIVFFFLFNPFFCFFLGEATKFGRNDSSSPAPPTSLSTAGVQSQPQQAPQAGTQGQGQGQSPAQQTQSQAFLNPPLPPGYGYTGKGSRFFLRKKILEWMTCHNYFLMGLAHLETGLSLFIFSLCSNIYCISKCVWALNFKKYISTSNRSSISLLIQELCVTVCFGFSKRLHEFFLLSLHHSGITVCIFWARSWFYLFKLAVLQVCLTILECQGFPQPSSTALPSLCLLLRQSSLQWAWPTPPISTTNSISPVTGSMHTAQVRTTLWLKVIGYNW